MTKPNDRIHNSQALLAELAAQTVALDRGQVQGVPTDIHYVYVHFYRGKKELGDLPYATALSALVEDTYLWPEAGKENRQRERGELDLQEADSLRFQSH
jgi:hypothetical protein